LNSLECAATATATANQQLSPKIRGRGNHRRIAESFEAGRNSEDNTTTTAVETSPKSSSGTNTPNATAHDSSDRKDFDVALSKTIGTKCPTRLWIRRRTFSKVKRMNRRQQQGSSSDDGLGAVMLEQGDCYQPGNDYFGKSDSKGTKEQDEPGENTNHNAASIPNPYRSTHIYAIRCSDQESTNERQGDDDSLSGGGLESSRERGSSPSDSGAKPRTESPPLPATEVGGSAGSTTKSPLEDLLLEDPAASGAMIFEPSLVALKPKRDVVSWTQVSKEHSIYVVDLGLTEDECNSVVTTTEQVCQGRYAAYTYAKQTLGCREYPLLARAAYGPVHSMVGAILKKFGGKGPAKPIAKSATAKTANANAKRTTAKPSQTAAAATSGSSNSGSGGDAGPCKPSFRYVKTFHLQLDDREPHIVKYDVTKKERQKLDMHTDKSEWTFLIALSNGCGVDYEGGGTYFESLDATVHIQKGHALVFPGALRHRGQAIHHGLRFLLVGFLIDKGGGFKAVVPQQAPPNHQAARPVLATAGTPKGTTNSGPVPTTTTTTLSDDAGLTQDSPLLAPMVAAA